MQAQGFSEELGLEDAAELDDTAYDQAGTHASSSQATQPQENLSNMPSAGVHGNEVAGIAQSKWQLPAV